MPQLPKGPLEFSRAAGIPAPGDVRPPSRAPRFPVSLPGDMWGVATYFNPARYPGKYRNLKLFAERVRSQGLKLIVVELQFDHAPFEVEEPIADCVLRLRSSAVLWQKERLFNRALAALPDSCDKVVWLDADILFENPAWVGQTAALLEEYKLVQPFEGAGWLPEGLTARPEVELPPSDGVARAKYYGVAYAQTVSPNQNILRQSSHTGFAWAARRGVIESHGFYDRFVLGGGDLVMCAAMFGYAAAWLGRSWAGKFCSEAQIQDLLEWSDAFWNTVRGSVSYTGGDVLHLWHGRMENRRYFTRLVILKEERFDPRADIALDGDSCWTWNSDKPELHRRVREYFEGRKEDSS